MTAKVPTIIPVSGLRKGAARVLADVTRSDEPIFITRRGRATAVLVGIDAYARAEADREILLRLARGEREIADGAGHALDEVMAEADALLVDG
jgi:prevent-host-death family protein